MNTFLRFLFAALLGLSVLGTPGMARAESEPGGHKFCINGIPDVSTFRADVDHSIAADSSGNRNVRNCLATPNLFVQAILIGNPKASVGGQPLTAGNLSAYMGKLVPVALDKDSTVESSLLWQTSAGLAVKVSNDARDLYKGEKVLKDPDTGAMVMMTGCANPNVVVNKPVTVTASACVKVKYPPLQKGVAIRIAFVGPNALPNRCLKNSIGGVDSDVFPQECPNSYDKTLPTGQVVAVNCNFRAIEQRVTQVLGKPSQVQNLSYSYRARADEGQDWVLLPLRAKEGVLAICWDMPDGTVVTVGVVREDYVQQADASLPWVATVTPEHARTIGAVH